MIMCIYLEKQVSSVDNVAYLEKKHVSDKKIKKLY